MLSDVLHPIQDGLVSIPAHLQQVHRLLQYETQHVMLLQVHWAIC